jgi:hypothetical protein
MTPFDPTTFHLSVPGGLLDLMHRTQNGDCTCMFAAKAICEKVDELNEEIRHLREVERELRDEKYRLNLALEARARENKFRYSDGRGGY